MLYRADIVFLYKFAAGIFPEGEVPKWLSEHRAIKEKEEIPKIFPKFGLNNFKEKVSLSPEYSVDTSYVSDTIRELFDKTYNIRRQLTATLAPLAAREQGEKYEFINYIISETSFVLTSFARALKRDSYLLLPSGKIKLVLANDVEIADPRFVKVTTLARKGEGIQKTYNKIREFITKSLNQINIPNPMPELDQIQAIKTFNSKNIPILGDKFYVVFSSTGQKGAWDIATMGMRGISTCQSWDPKSESPDTLNACLIGSVASRYVGVIYLTTEEETQRGEKMNKRCVVRLGYDRKTKEPLILLDKMYDKYDPNIAEIFINALQKRTNIKVVDLNIHSRDAEGRIENISIPLEQIPGLVPDIHAIHPDAREGVGEYSYEDFPLHKDYRLPQE